VSSAARARASRRTTAAPWRGGCPPTEPRRPSATRGRR
jgi:hypothetical protein